MSKYINNMIEQTFQALSDKNRIKILELLKKKDMSVSEILENFSITNASLSHHLDILKRVNLVVSERKGQFIYYSLNTSVFEDVLVQMSKFFNKK